MTPNQRLVEVHRLGWRVTAEGEMLKPDGSAQPVNKDKCGYWRFSVKLDDGLVRSVYVHRLQAYQKFGSRLFETGIEVRHLNGEADNSARHIEIGTKNQNESDKPLAVRKAFVAGAGRAARKLTDEQVIQLRKDREAGAKYSQLAEKYGVRSSTISYIVRGVTCKVSVT